MNRFVGLLIISLAIVSKSFASETSNINKLDLMNYHPSQRAAAEEIIHSLGEKNKDLEIFDGHLFQPPKNLRRQLSDASLEYYYRISTARPQTTPNEHYAIESSDNFIAFKTQSRTHKKIDRQMKTGSILSFIYFADSEIVYDVLPPNGRFTMSLNEESYFLSNSMGKSITSYLMGHAICRGYIGGIDSIISDWPLMENTLYFGQPIVRLLNMSAGDTNVIKENAITFTKTGAHIHTQPLIDAAENLDELKNTKPVRDAAYSYSNLTSDILLNYIAHKVGDDFEKFLSEFYQQKIGIKYPVYQWVSPLRRNATLTVENLTDQGAWQYGMLATRYDFL